MLRHGCLIILLFVAILVMIPVVVSNYVPGWGVFLVILGELAALRYGIPFLIKYGVSRFASSLIRKKSSVLRDAGVHVHRVERTTAPENAKRIEHHQEVESDSGEATLIGATPADEFYVLVEFTLTPRQAQSKTAFYDPSELRLVPLDKVVQFSAGASQQPDDSDAATLVSISPLTETGDERIGMSEISGRARFKAVFAIPPTMTGRVKFQYYFETFGDFLLPATTP